MGLYRLSNSRGSGWLLSLSRKRMADSQRADGSLFSGSANSLLFLMGELSYSCCHTVDALSISSCVLCWFSFLHCKTENRGTHAGGGVDGMGCLADLDLSVFSRTTPSPVFAWKRLSCWWWTESHRTAAAKPPPPWLRGHSVNDLVEGVLWTETSLLCAVLSSPCGISALFRAIPPLPLQLCWLQEERALVDPVRGDFSPSPEMFSQCPRSLFLPPFWVSYVCIYLFTIYCRET